MQQIFPPYALFAAALAFTFARRLGPCPVGQ